MDLLHSRSSSDAAIAHHQSQPIDPLTLYPQTPHPATNPTTKTSAFHPLTPSPPLLPTPLSSASTAPTSAPPLHSTLNPVSSTSPTCASTQLEKIVLSRPLGGQYWKHSPATWTLAVQQMASVSRGWAPG